MTTDTVGGVFTYTVELAAGLTRAGDEVLVATFGRALSESQRRRLVEAGAEVVLETSLALEWMPDPWRDLRMAEEYLLELGQTYRPDLVHLNDYGHGAAVWDAPVVVVGHSCVYSWWEAVHGCRPPQAWTRYRARVRSGLRGATAVVAPTGAMARALGECYGPLPDPVRVIHNGSAYAPPAPVPKRAVVLSAGRLWDRAKNVAILERVAGQACLDGRVILAGEHGDAAAPDHARHLGPLSHDALAAVRATAAVYAAPACYEPFGLGILEAARDRCALVLGDIASLREVWGDAAVFVAPDDEDQLAATLRDLLQRPDHTAALGARARSRSWRFSRDVMTGAYRSLYRSLVRAEEGMAA